MPRIAGLMTEEATRTHDADILNQSIHYAHLRDISNDEQTAARDLARISESNSAIATLVDVIETKGVCLACGPELD